MGKMYLFQAFPYMCAQIQQVKVVYVKCHTIHSKRFLKFATPSHSEYTYHTSDGGNIRSVHIMETLLYKLVGV